jgi:hypothetical protein
MNAIGAYAVVLSREAARQHGPARPTNGRDGVDREPRPGLGERVRKLFGSGPRILREPGFAASDTWLDEFVPKLTAYPYPNAIR